MRQSIALSLIEMMPCIRVKFTEQIAEMEELYGYYRCPTCSAPITSRAPWEHEYGTEEVTEYRLWRV